MRIGVVTGGGDCAGLNAVIRGVCHRASENNFPNVIGIHNGFWGLFGVDPMYPNEPPEGFHASTIYYDHQNPQDTEHPKWSTAGTILGSVKDKIKQLDEGDADFDPQVAQMYYDNLGNNIEVLGLEALVVTGGDGNLKFAQKKHKILAKMGINIPIFGIPKTIDGNVAGVEGFTLGFHSARDYNANIIQSLHLNAQSMGMTHIVQIMGGDCGALAFHSAIKSKVADIVIIPEMGYNMESIVTAIKTLRRLGQRQVMIVIAEGMPDLNGKELGTVRYGTTLTTGNPNKYLADELKRVMPVLKIRDQNTTHGQRTPKFSHLHDFKLGNYLGAFAVDRAFEQYQQLKTDPTIKIESGMIAHGHKPDEGAWVIPLNDVANMKPPKLKPEEAVRLSQGHFVFGCESPEVIERILTHRNEWFGRQTGLERIPVTTIKKSIPSSSVCSITA